MKENESNERREPIGHFTADMVHSMPDQFLCNGCKKPLVSVIKNAATMTVTLKFHPRAHPIPVNPKPPYMDFRCRICEAVTRVPI